MVLPRTYALRFANQAQFRCAWASYVKCTYHLRSCLRSIFWGECDISSILTIRHALQESYTYQCKSSNGSDHVQICDSAAT